MERNKLIQQKIDKIKELQDDGINPYPYKFNKKNSIIDIHSDFENLEKNKTVVQTAGRIMLMRKMGKAAFATISDETGKIQFFIRVNEVGKESFELFKKLDIGDIIGVKGTVVKTKTGEETVFVQEFELLSKSVRALPEKFHGIKDTELRYRQRYVDLIMNDNVKDIFKKRNLIIKTIRNLLDNENFLEVETPMMQSIPGGAAAKPFITHHNTLDMDLYLRIAPELYLKRLIVGGFEKVYEINRNFRNEGISTKHNPEFTMLELYSAYDDYNDMMNICEQIVYQTCLKINESDTVEYKGETLNLKPPFKRLKYFDALNEKIGFNIRESDLDTVKKTAEKYEIKVDEKSVKSELINELFETLVEPDLIQPTFIIDYPVEISPLTKQHREDDGLVERFELFIANSELGNAYSELNNPVEQNKRFTEQIKLKETTESDEIFEKIDFDFLRALEYGMPPTGGLGIGIDRLVMILTNTESIREVIFFPQLRAEEFTDF